jgi:hypothetical protein
MRLCRQVFPGRHISGLISHGLLQSRAGGRPSGRPAFTHTGPIPRTVLHSPSILPQTGQDCQCPLGDYGTAARCRRGTSGDGSASRHQRVNPQSAISRDCLTGLRCHQVARTGTLRPATGPSSERASSSARPGASTSIGSAAHLPSLTTPGAGSKNTPRFSRAACPAGWPGHASAGASSWMYSLFCLYQPARGTKMAAVTSMAMAKNQ